jgi:hypothetical protein
MEHPDPRAFLFTPGAALAPAADCVELVLNRADGGDWVLRMSAGAERFVGRYPRLGGIDGGGPLLMFRKAGGGAEIALADEALEEDAEIPLPRPPKASSGEAEAVPPSSAGDRMRRLTAALRRRLRR